MVHVFDVMTGKRKEGRVKGPAFLMMAAVLALPMAKAQTVHVVTETSYLTRVVDGKPTGLAVDIVESSLKNAGLQLSSTDIFPWARAYQLALREPNTLIFPMARTPEREQLFKWAGELQKIHYYFFKLSSRKDIVIKNLADAKAYSVGVVRDDVRHQYLVGNGFNNLLVSAKWNDNIVRLLNRQVDIVTLADFSLLPMCEEMAINCSSLERVYQLDELSTGLYMAFSKATPDAVVERTRAAFQKMKADGTLERMVKQQKP